MRQLAREALNRWDRGTYVRLTVNAAWIALEVFCQEFFERPEIGRRFKENFNKALIDHHLEAVDWSRGLWQSVQELQQFRNSNVHKFLSLKDMFPESSNADEAVFIVRGAIADICARKKTEQPTWLHIDEMRGWQTKKNVSSITGCLIKGDASVDDPNCFRIYIVVRGEEKLTTVLREAAEVDTDVNYLLTNFRTPINAIRVYKGSELMRELLIHTRGN